MNKRGGGVLIAVLSTIPSSLFIVSAEFDFDFVCVKLIHIAGSIFVACLYIPTSSDIDTYMKLLLLFGKVFRHMKPCDSFLVLGDFNLPDVSWRYEEDASYLTPFAYPNVFEEFFDTVFDLNLV